MIKKLQSGNTIETLLANIFKQQGNIAKDSKLSGLSSMINGGLETLSSALPQVDHKNAVNTALDIGSQVAGLIPGPWGVGISAGLKGINLLDQALGKNAKTQATLGETTKGYGLQFNSDAGTKYGGLFGVGKRKKANYLTANFDVANIQKLNTAKTAEQDALAARNAEQNIQSQNYNQLMGGFNNKLISVKNGGYIKKLYQKFQQGGQMNVIPEGALHSRKNNLDIDVTPKGIPVITKEEGGEIEQQAEIERNEITFNYNISKKLEEYTKKYNETESDKEKNEIAIELGKILTEEIMENTQDNTGLIDKVE